MLCCWFGGCRSWGWGCGLAWDVRHANVDVAINVDSWVHSHLRMQHRYVTCILHAQCSGISHQQLSEPGGVSSRQLRCPHIHRHISAAAARARGSNAAAGGGVDAWEAGAAQRRRHRGIDPHVHADTGVAHAMRQRRGDGHAPGELQQLRQQAEESRRRGDCCRRALRPCCRAAAGAGAEGCAGSGIIVW